MPIYTYLDIETTGLSRQNDAPIQFAYLQMADNGVFLKRGAFYINTTCSSWSQEAEGVHHISREMLKKYGVEEVRAIASIYAILKDAAVVTYNGNSFDLPMINNRIQQLGITDIYTEQGFDVMVEWQKFHGGKRRRLVDLAKELGYTEAYISSVVKRLFGEDGKFRPHDARYDVVETMLVHRRLLADMAAATKAEAAPPKQEAVVDLSTIRRPEV